MELSVLNIFNQQYTVIDDVVKEVRKRSLGRRLRVAITGVDYEIIARTALALMDDNHQVILLPKEGMDFPNQPIDLTLHLNRFELTIEENSLAKNFNIATVTDPTIIWDEFDVVMYTSGTTGNAKPIALKRDHLDYTVQKYRELYGTDENTLILSSLPASYNFTFISAAYQSHVNGHNFKIVPDNVIVSEIKKAQGKESRVIVIANPIVLQLIADNLEELGDNLLVDSGGAPLSKSTIEYYRNKGIDLREGYGLTETSSLTHFDIEGTPDSIGTVGKPIEGVSCQIIKNNDGKPILSVTSPNAGVNLMSSPSQWINTVNTGDVARIDGDGRVRLLGREIDAAINHLWPKDTLDLIGPELGYRCAGIRHFAEQRAWIRVLGDLDDETRMNIQEITLDALAIPPEDLYIDAYSDALLHSVKLPSPKM